MKFVWTTEEHNGRQKSVGTMFGIAPSVVNRQLKAARYDVYRQAWNSLSEHLATIDDYIIEKEGESI